MEAVCDFYEADWVKLGLVFSIWLLAGLVFYFTECHEIGPSLIGGLFSFILCYWYLMELTEELDTYTGCIVMFYCMLGAVSRGFTTNLWWLIVVLPYVVQVFIVASQSVLRFWKRGIII